VLIIFFVALVFDQFVNKLIFSLLKLQVIRFKKIKSKRTVNIHLILNNKREFSHL
jgi:hypothetical protein